ncbi:MAG: NAD(P)/FAD-dependent oxidoreductase [Chloroflexota bacterium]|nr:NAD(P)/FAD-dependent oxidoreductase [Chloroflexota bacterium]
MERVDVAIVGGGPAGLSAALMLGRCCRSVVVVDAGEHRNRKAGAVHGFLTRDGTPPADLLRAARADLERYPEVTLRTGVVSAITGARGTFELRLADGAPFQARRVLLATGVIDVVPAIEGLPELFGRSVHHCAHCDGYEYAGTPIAVYGQARPGIEAALAMLAWSDDVVLLTDARPLVPADRTRLEALGVPVREERVVRLEGTAGQLERVVFADGPALARSGLFLVAGQREQSELAKQLGCELTAEGMVKADQHAVTSVPGVYVAGDAGVGEQMVIVAAAQGTIAATKIHASLGEEDLRSRAAHRAAAG